MLDIYEYRQNIVHTIRGERGMSWKLYYKQDTSVNWSSMTLWLAAVGRETSLPADDHGPVMFLYNYRS